MAKIVEVDEAEYNQMVALRQVASKMVANKQSRVLLERAQKLIDDKAPTPTLDAEEAQMAPVREMEKKLSEEIAALKKERDDEKREQTLATHQRQSGKSFQPPETSTALHRRRHRCHQETDGSEGSA